MYGFSGDNTWCRALNGPEFVRDNRSLAVNGLTEGVDNAAQKSITRWHLNNTLGSLDQIAFFNKGVGTKQNRADTVFLKVQYHTEYVARKLQKLAGHALFQSMDPRDAVSDLQHSTGIFDLKLRLVF